MKKITIYRQGDVLLKQVREIPADAKRQKPNGPVILALGEVTGHKHQIAENLDAVDVFVKGDGTMYLQVKNETSLKHEEHATVVLPVGNYERVIQREYSPEAIRNVAD